MLTATGPLADLAIELKRQAANSRELMADTELVSILNPEAENEPPLMLVDLNGEVAEFGIKDHAHGQIATHFEIPRRLYNRLMDQHPPLHEHLLNGLLTRESSTRRLRILDGQVRAFLSDRYRPRDNWDLLNEAVLPVIEEFPGRAVVRKADLTDTRMYVKITLPDFEMPVTPKVGDVIHGGVIIQNSEVGAGSLGIYPYTEVLWCTNGAVHTEYGKRTRHVGRRIESEVVEAWELYSDETIRLDDQAFFAKCADVLRAVLNESVFDAIVKDMRELAGIKVKGAPDKVIEIFTEKNRLRESERDTMLEKLIAGADLTGWGYVNALTETARDLEDPDRQTELQTLAGGLVTDPSWALALAG